MLYINADLCKGNSEENRFPIPCYLIDAFAKYDCDERNPKRILEKLSSSIDIEGIIKLYLAVTKAYTQEFYEKNSYNIYRT